MYIIKENEVKSLRLFTPFPSLSVIAAFIYFRAVFFYFLLSIIVYNKALPFFIYQYVIIHSIQMTRAHTRKKKDGRSVLF